MGFYKKPREREGRRGRFLPLLILFSILLLGVVSLILLFDTNSVSYTLRWNTSTTNNNNLLENSLDFNTHESQPNMPKHNKLSIQLHKRNLMPPTNLHLFPNLAQDHITIVLYVHNRPRYLQVVVDSLSKVDGIHETLLVVSHDGYFPEMNKIVGGIRFCRVKQIFAPYSPHLFTDAFPGVSRGDCREKGEKNCRGDPDQYGNYRSPKIVSLKHHWWWMMNTVWDGLQETREHLGHILFIEEDHFIFPNAYRNIQLLSALKPEKCPDCYAVNLAPSDVKSRGEGSDCLIAEKIGNVGYAFNRTVWRKIHSKARDFCMFDEYNWDITMWATVYPSFGSSVYTLRGPRTSATHFGTCGLHQGQGDKGVCIDKGTVSVEVEDIDKIANINSKWSVRFVTHQSGYRAGFKGWGGWGDERDRQLCMDFAKMYHLGRRNHQV